MPAHSSQPATASHFLIGPQHTATQPAQPISNRDNRRLQQRTILSAKMRRMSQQSQQHRIPRKAGTQTQAQSLQVVTYVKMQPSRYVRMVNNNVLLAPPYCINVWEQCNLHKISVSQQNEEIATDNDNEQILHHRGKWGTRSDRTQNEATGQATGHCDATQQSHTCHFSTRAFGAFAAFAIEYWYFFQLEYFHWILPIDLD